MFRTIVLLVFLSGTGFLVSCSKSSLASHPQQEIGTNDQHANKNENTNVQQETIDAYEPGSKVDYDLCANAKTRTDEVECFVKELKKADRKMTALFDAFIARFKVDPGSDVERRYAEKHIANLRNTQRVWLIYRDENCKAEQDLYEEGAEAVLNGVICRFEMTGERIKELKRIYAQK